MAVGRRSRRRLVVLGAGTAGTMVVNRLRPRLDRDAWEIVVVDRDDLHHYQPGFLFVPFGGADPERQARARHTLITDGVELVLAEVEHVDADAHVVRLAGGRTLAYDWLVVATGTSTRPDQTPGMLGPEWRRSIHDFYTPDGATALARALEGFDRGRLVVHVTDVPIKCPVAPLELTFLADDWLRRRGRRDRVEIVYATPLGEAFTRPVAASRLGSMLDDRDIRLEPDLLVEHVDPGRRELVSYDDRRVPFDLLVTVPLNMGADVVSRSGLGDELGYVPVDRATFRSTAHPEIFALGDANDVPTSKAGSVAHFGVDVFVENFLDLAAGRPPSRRFDGHAMCFVESGDRKALLLDFDYEHEPLPGGYPLPGVGPLRLLAESRTNHLGKLAFRWVYWNVLLPGRPLPLPSRTPARRAA